MVRPLAGLFVAGGLALGVVLSNGAAPALWRSLERNDRLHYAVHLFAGRVFSLCDCTRGLADNQYYRGLFHARTTRQVELLTTAAPESPRARVKEVPELSAGVLRWAQADARRLRVRLSTRLKSALG